MKLPKSKQEWEEAESKPYDGRFDKEWESMTTEEQAIEIVKRVYAGYGDHKKCITWVKDFLAQSRRETIEEIYHAINDGIFDDITYEPRKGRHGLEDSWWAGVDDVQMVVSKRLNKVKKKYKII